MAWQAGCIEKPFRRLSCALGGAPTREAENDPQTRVRDRWNGDRRLTLAGPAPFAFNLPGDASYALTIRRSGVEQTVTLSRGSPATSAEWWGSLSQVAAASAWFVLATMIALLRPELAIARWLYAAAIVIGLEFVRGAAQPLMPWLPDWWKSALLLAVPHRAYRDLGEAELGAKLTPAGILIDLKSALDPNRLPASNSYWSL